MAGSEIELDAIPRRVRSGTDDARTPSAEASEQRVPETVMERLKPGERFVVGRKRFGLYPYVKRSGDVLGAAALLLAFSPLILAVALVIGVRNRGRIFERTKKIGRASRPFIEYAFATDARIIRQLPLLFNILRGDMSFIGPRALAPTELLAYLASDPQAERRHDVRPGLLCDWWIRRHVNLDYVSEAALDAGYAETCSLSRDASVVFRSLPGLVTYVLWGDDPPNYDAIIHILGVRINNIPMQSAIDRVLAMLDDPNTHHACFINPHAINEAQTIAPYRKSLIDADLVLADGFGTKLAGKILRRPLCQNLCGTDLFPRLCEELAAKERSLYLLGGAPGVADRVVLWLNEHYPGIEIKGCAHGHFAEEDEAAVVRKVADSGADLLIVGMGVPIQDIWIHDHIDSLGVPVAMSFGGLFDYFAGRVPRAPQWVREMGMEWLYRLIQEPRRLWRRYLIGNGLFLARVFREKLNPSRYSSR